MRSIIRKFSQLGAIYRSRGNPLEVLQLETLPIPEIEETKDVILKMVCSPIHPSDINKIEGTYGNLPDIPCVGGIEGVGIVEEVGSGVSKLEVGDVVIPTCQGSGVWSEYSKFCEDELMIVPKGITHEVAATIRINPLTAFMLLNSFFDLQEGDCVIQNGATSAVGKAVIQICDVMNVDTVNIIRDRPDFQEVSDGLTELGATAVLTLEDLPNYECETKPALALNCVGGDYAKNMCKKLDTGGICVTYGGMSRKPFHIGTGQFIFQRLTLTGFWLDGHTQEEKNAGLKRMFDFVELEMEKEWQTDVVEFALEEFDQALEYYYNREFTAGKVLLRM